MNPTLFSDVALAKLVKDTIPADLTDRHVVIGTVDQHGAQIVASFEFKDRWELQAAARHEWKGDTVIGAKVLLHW